MALIIGVAVGRSFYIDNTRVRVAKVITPSEYILVCRGVSYNISDTEAVEVYPSVRISSGLFGTTDLARLVIEAPRSIKIDRRKGYVSGKD